MQIFKIIEGKDGFKLYRMIGGKEMFLKSSIFETPLYVVVKKLSRSNPYKVDVVYEA